MENGEVTSVLEYIDFLHAILGRLSIEEIDYSDYCQMTDYLDEIEKRVKQLEKKQEPMKPTYDHRYAEMGCSVWGNMVSGWEELPNYCPNCGQSIDWREDE